MIIVQLILYCALFTLMVEPGVGNSALNGLFFYPKPVQDKAYALGLADRQTVGRNRKRFMTAFFAVMGAALVLINPRRLEHGFGRVAGRSVYAHRQRKWIGLWREGCQ